MSIGSRVYVRYHTWIPRAWAGEKHAPVPYNWSLTDLIIG